jgi:hypothetical protein
MPKKGASPSCPTNCCAPAPSRAGPTSSPTYRSGPTATAARSTPTAPRSTPRRRSRTRTATTRRPSPPGRSTRRSPRTAPTSGCSTTTPAPSTALPPTRSRSRSAFPSKRPAADAHGVLTATRYLNNPLADNILDAVKQKAIKAQSFSGRFIQSKRIRAERSGALPQIHRNEVALREYGPTPFPAYGQAHVVGTRSTELWMADLLAMDREERADLFARMVELATPLARRPTPSEFVREHIALAGTRHGCRARREVDPSDGTTPETPAATEPPAATPTEEPAPETPATSTPEAGTADEPPIALRSATHDRPAAEDPRRQDHERNVIPLQTLQEIIARQAAIRTELDNLAALAAPEGDDAARSRPSPTATPSPTNCSPSGTPWTRRASRSPLARAASTPYVPRRPGQPCEPGARHLRGAERQHQA